MMPKILIMHSTHQKYSYPMIIISKDSLLQIHKFFLKIYNTKKCIMGVNNFFH